MSEEIQNNQGYGADQIQILEGLYAGEKVIVEGMLSVSDGIKVNDISNPALNQEKTESSSDVKNNL